MNKKKLKFRVLGLIIFIFAVNWLAMHFFWYYSLWWLDMLMHFLGGFWVALAVILFIPPKENFSKFVSKILLLSLSVIVFWEVFEIVLYQIGLNQFFDFRDTVSDVFFGIAGALTALVYFFQRIMFQIKDRL